MPPPREPERRRRPRQPAAAGRPRAAAARTEPAAVDRDEPLVVVRFKGERKGYYHNRKGVELRVGQYCLVQADRGCDLGRIAYHGPGRPAWWQEAARQGVLAAATAADLERLPELRREEVRARTIARQRIEDHGLPMQLVGAERRWDRNKLTFYFLAEGRVDFRALVRDLAGIFRTRIELRQIGVRDDARLKGGLGICGRPFCCSSFLADFCSVGLRMAKDQQLPLNPSKLSGPCGRLRCCLAFEHAAYKEQLQRVPGPGKKAVWGERTVRVRKVDPLREIVTVQVLDEDQPLQEVPFAELAPAVAQPRDEPRDGPPSDPDPGPDRAAEGARRRRRWRRPGGRRNDPQREDGSA